MPTRFFDPNGLVGGRDHQIDRCAVHHDGGLDAEQSEHRRGEGQGVVLPQVHPAPALAVADPDAARVRVVPAAEDGTPSRRVGRLSLRRP